MSIKILIRIGINTLIGVILIFVWLKFVDINQLFLTIKTVNLRYIGLFFVFVVISTLIRAARLKLLLKEFKLFFKELFFLNFLSQFLSFIIPLRVGEIAKSVYLHQRTDAPLSKTVIWVLIDRFMDFWVDLVIITALILTISSNIDKSLVKVIFVVLFIFSLIPLVIIINAEFFKKIVVFFANFIPFKNFRAKLVNTSLGIIEGFNILKRHPIELISLFGLTIAATISDSFLMYTMFYSFNVTLPFFKNLLGSLLLTLTFLVPAAPGYVGSAEASGLAVYVGVLGLDSNISGAAIVLNHLLTTVVLLVFGVISLYFLKFNLGSVWKKLRKED